MMGRFMCDLKAVGPSGGNPSVAAGLALREHP
jgi:hypothetical protein